MEHRFEPAAQTVREARRFVRSALHTWQVPEGYSVVLVSELATNAVLHARTSYTVSVVSVAPDRVRVEVTDDDPTPPHSDHLCSEDATGGRGMQLVSGLSRDWGCNVAPEGKTVWFET